MTGLAQRDDGRGRGRVGKAERVGGGEVRALGGWDGGAPGDAGAGALELAPCSAATGAAPHSARAAPPPKSSAPGTPKHQGFFSGSAPFVPPSRFSPATRHRELGTLLPRQPDAGPLSSSPVSHCTRRRTLINTPEVCRFAPGGSLLPSIFVQRPVRRGHERCSIWSSCGSFVFHLGKWAWLYTVETRSAAGPG